MPLDICTIYDSKAEAYMTPLFFQSKGQAVRSFSDAINDPTHNTDISKHPEDFTLFHLGHFNERNGTIVVLPTPVSIATGINLTQEPQLT